jgi:hypothetical protein
MAPASRSRATIGASAEAICSASAATPDWLANAGYEVVDAEPPQIAEAAVAWFDAIWADVGTLWPGSRLPDATRSSWSRRAWRKECSSPSTKRRSLKPGRPCTN